MGMTNYLANLILDHLAARGQYVNVGDDIYLGLSTTAPAVDGTNVTEPSGDGYARVLLGKYGQSATLKIGAASGGASTNTDAIHFPECHNGTSTGDWGTCTHFVIYDALTGGNLLLYGALGASIDPDEGEIVVVRAGDLDISLA